MFDFLFKHHKVIVAGSLALATIGASSYFLGDSNDQEAIRKKKEQEKKEAEENESVKKQLGMTKSEAKEKMKELVQKVKQSSEEAFKETVRKEIKVEYYGNVISDKTIKIIMHRSVLIGLDSLLKIHASMLKDRQSKYNDIPEYASKANELIQNFFYVLNISMENITKILEITFDLFQASLKYWQIQQKIQKGYIRDLAWHFMAEDQIQQPMTKENYVRYLQFICEEIPQQQAEIREALKSSPQQLQRIVALARSEDKAFFELKISDLEAMKALSLYSQDPVCKELLLKRNSLLNESIPAV